MVMMSCLALYNPLADFGFDVYRTVLCRERKSPCACTSDLYIYIISYIYIYVYIHIINIYMYIYICIYVCMYLLRLVCVENGLTKLGASEGFKPSWLRGFWGAGALGRGFRA